MKITIAHDHKSIPSQAPFNLPDFSVIIGINGSGKTHLLEALNDCNITSIENSGIQLAHRMFLPFGALTPHIEVSCDPDQIKSSVKVLWDDIYNTQKNIRDSSRIHPDEKDANPYKKELSIFMFNLVDSMMRNTSKGFLELNEEDVLYSIDTINNPNGIFSTRLAFIFKTYHTRYIKNQFKIFLNQNGNTSSRTLSEQEFLDLYGPRPWDLVNELISKIGLPYEVIGPDGMEIDSTYALNFINKKNNKKISTVDFSTGEKVLLSLALAIYNSNSPSGKLDLLILDEPDAPLHPHFSKILIETLKDILVDKAGIKVIITTHSPSTAAFCPDNSLFEMDREERTPKMISIDRAVETLTSGIPYLKVKNDNRLQVFVESKYDTLYYEHLFQLIKKTDIIDYHPIFLEPHSGTSNCSDVESIVTRLYDAGNDVVRGIIDWDNEKTNTHPIYVLGGGRRYAIENYILDPFYIALSLIRAGKRTLSQFSISHIDTYVEISKINVQDIQNTSNLILTKVGIDINVTKPCTLLNGWTIDLPTSFLSMPGHAWEKLLLSTFQELKSVCVNNNDSGLKLGVLKSIREFPQFFSCDIRETFIDINNKN